MLRILILFSTYLICLSSSAQTEFVFKHLNSRNGLSNNSVTSIIQDKKGFIWFGTSSGLNRYDGYTFKIFKYNADDSCSLSDNKVRALALDTLGQIWVGTNNGLNCFNPTLETFRRFYSTKNNKNSISDNRISSLYISRNNCIWVGTENGLNKLLLSNMAITQLTYQLKTRFNTIANSVNSITEDKQGIIWIGMWLGGLKKINPNSLQVTNFFSNQTIKNSINNDNVLSVFCDNSNMLWITNYMGSIRKMNPLNGEFFQVKDMERHINLGAIVQDKSGNIWIKNDPGTILTYDPLKQSTTIHKNRLNDVSSISTGSIFSIFCDRSGIVWIGTDKGITYFDPKTRNFAKYFHQLNIGKRDYCNSFFQDKYKQLWIVVYDVGLVRYNLLSKDLRVLTYNPGNPNSINHKTINGIFANKKGELWIATNNGVCVLDPISCRVLNRLYFTKDNSPALLNGVNVKITGKQSRYFWNIEGGLVDIENPEKIFQAPRGKISLNELKIKCIIADKNGDCWIGTEYFGLIHFHTQTNEITEYINNPSNTSSISSNSINDIFEDKNGFIWIATENGLNKFDTVNSTFTTYTRKQGLSANECFSVKEDSYSNIWVLNSEGLDKINIKTGKVVNYGESDGLSLNQSGLYLTDNGYFVGGHTENGFYLFHPDSIIDKSIDQNVLITDFYILNESVAISTLKLKTPLTTSITETKEIILNHNQSVFGFEFSALNFSDRRKNRYNYKLEGFDNKWFISDDNNRRITYTNLNPGNYVFRVKTGNGNEHAHARETKINLTVLPPFWKTWWAYSIYFLVLSIVLFFIRKYFADKHKFQHEIAIQKLENTKTEELAQLKQQFFTNISHEFRTPLTLISGPADKIIRNIESIEKPRLLENMYLIQRNTERLLQLTNQLLDIRKLESGSMKLEVIKGNVVDFIRNIAMVFNALAEKKQITYNITTNNTIELVDPQWFDTDKLTKIVSNLLSNAFKFTPDKGEVEINIRGNYALDNTYNWQLVENNTSSFITVTVKDSGVGIAKELTEKIFDSFFQVENAHNRSAEGTGIGLSLTKELVMLHGGNISVESELGKGSTFTVTIPVGKSLFKNFVEFKNELNTSDKPVIEEFTLPIAKVDQDNKNLNNIIERNETLPLILLVEDNADMRLFVRNILVEHYRVEETENGVEGLKKAFAGLPDLIVSDVMMPEMDGFEFVKNIRNDQRTSHIPVILLTSLTANESIIKGLEYEADEYITKPFNEQVMLLKARNMIASRQKLIRHYTEHIDAHLKQQKAGINLEPKQPEIPNSEKIFLDKIMVILEQNMTEASFDVQQFASAIGMEASVLHRKLKALVNQSPGDFLRAMRMKRAEQLLLNKSLPISEVAFMVGFGNNTNYFSTAFKKYSGKSPKEFQSQL